MKKRLFLLAMCLISVVYSFGQTTNEEYNYITKGLKIQLSSGLDPKKGYEFKLVSNRDNSGKKIEIWKVIRTENKSIACLFVKFTNFSTFFFCIPNPNSEQVIINKCYKDIYANLGNESVTLLLFNLLPVIDWKTI